MTKDWVKNDLGEIQQVVEIRANGVVLYYNDLYGYDEIEPIPLTPEILKKNGFVLIESKEGSEHWALIDNCGEYWCELYKIANGYVSKESIYIGFVHQLQHLLKMYGNFSKEIVL